MKRSSAIVAFVLVAPLIAAGCAAPARHVPVADYWLEPGAREAGSAAPAPAAGAPLRVAVYGDTRGNRAAHRAVIAAIRTAKPHVVVYTGDALECRPAAHMPDLGAWTYLIPFWPQWWRGHPAFSAATIVPFPAAIHEVFASPWVRIRDIDGFNGFLEDTAPLRVEDRTPFLFVPGNHDLYHRADREAVARLFGSPFGDGGRDPDALWFAADAAGVRFVVLDAGADLFGSPDPLDPAGPQLAWLDRTLADAENRGLRSIVCLHLPPFSSGSEDGPVPYIRERVVEGVLDRHRVDAVASGHAHAYERIERAGAGGRPVTYIVTGGGGAPFHHEAKSAAGRDPGSKVFVEETLHFVLLEVGPRSIRGRAIPVAPPPGSGARVAPQGDLDGFEVQLR